MIARSGRSRGSSSKSATRSPLAAVILAAGEGKRMKSSLPKVLHTAGGRPLAEHVVRAAHGAGARPVVVVFGHGAELVEATMRARIGGDGLLFAEQSERRGTADAVGRAGKALRRFRGDVLILCGDVPGLDAAALKTLVRHHRRRQAALTVLSAELDDPTGYGRIVRDARGELTGIVEQADASAGQRLLREINTGTYCADWRALSRALRRITPDNAQGEYYLTDAVRELLAEGLHVEAVVHPHPREATGVNSRRQLAAVHRMLNLRSIGRAMDGGATVLDPATTWIHDTVKIGRDVVIHPGVTLEGETRIGRGCEIRSGCRLTNVVLGREVLLLEHTVATDSRIGSEAQLGPFAHLRPGTAVGESCKVGNFVETKKTRMGRGSKASHLSYLGDSVLGRGVNIGAGTITCNYDGVHKHQTTLADGVFIGSDTQLVAPVRVGRGAYVGAGTTVTRDVPAGALALSRSDQRNIDGWVARQAEKKARKAGGKTKAEQAQGRSG